MVLQWGYSPKVERYIPLGKFPADRYLIIAQQAIENLGWKLSHLSESGIIAYTGLSLQSYSEEISIRIISNFAVFKSECIGVQMLFTDYGKNQQNLDKFFHEFEYVEFHLKDIWDERLDKFHAHVANQDDSYLSLAPLKAKDRIKNVLYLFYPQRDYLVTPVLVNLCILYFLFTWFYLFQIVSTNNNFIAPAELIAKGFIDLGANSRERVLSGEFWRLISGIFLHNSLAHLFFNMYSLIYIGLMVENKLGTISTVMVFFFGGICASLLSVVFHTTGFMVGASGAIMAMFGAFLALLVNHAFEKNANKALLISTCIVVSYMLISGMGNTKIDNPAHFGGAISGFVIGWILYGNTSNVLKKDLWLRRLSSLGIVLIFGIAVYVLCPNYQIKEYARLKSQFNANDSGYYRLYEIDRSMPRNEQLDLVKQYGIRLAELNLNIVDSMGMLTLTKRDRLDYSYRKIVAQKEHRAALLIYRDIKKGSKETRSRIQLLIHELNSLKIEQAGKLLKLR